MKTDTANQKTGYVFCGGSISEKLADCLPGLGPGERAAGAAYIVAADRGLVFLEKHGIVPDLIVGDFDSSPEGFIDEYRFRHPDVMIRTFDPEKDYTDSEIGVRAAVEQGCGHIVMIGSTGTRLDHVLGNIQVLAWLLSKAVSGEMIDPYNRITIHDRPFSVRKDSQWGKYVSFFAYGGDVTGLTLSGFHYTVKDFTLTSVGSRAVSNEIDLEEGMVSFSGGKLLMIESRDG